ncbi:MAG: ABC transporter permease, partial [Lachnospiraceae bacterium]|nr:ABC transporter permease [Lachnospiraceae bacterium]
MIKFYTKTALNGLKKNLKLYIPQIISTAVMFAIMYIMYSLCYEEALKHSRGGDYIGIFMILGVVVISILSLVIIFYANNFLMKQRKREYGLYHVLGLEKKHIINIMLVENIITHVTSIVLGTSLGILFYRLASLVIFKLYQLEVADNINILCVRALIYTLVIFVIIYALTYIFNCISLVRLKTTELLLSASYGEKEPKIKWIVFILGLAFLGAGYYIALTIEKPMEALGFFFVAVICVIFGTYFLFTAGSIFILKMLKSKKSYYYKPEHMISVSGMLYRMKQNAAGLASIAILATGVLIMLATTVTLYRGIDEDIENKFPHDMYFNIREWSDNNRVSRDFTEEEGLAALREACD